MSWIQHSMKNQCFHVCQRHAPKKSPRVAGVAATSASLRCPPKFSFHHTRYPAGGRSEGAGNLDLQRRTATTPRGRLPPSHPSQLRRDEHLLQQADIWGLPSLHVLQLLRDLPLHFATHLRASRVRPSREVRRDVSVFAHTSPTHFRGTYRRRVPGERAPRRRCERVGRGNSPEQPSHQECDDQAGIPSGNRHAASMRRPPARGRIRTRESRHASPSSKGPPERGATITAFRLPRSPTAQHHRCAPPESTRPFRCPALEGEERAVRSQIPSTSAPSDRQGRAAFDSPSTSPCTPPPPPEPQPRPPPPPPPHHSNLVSMFLLVLVDTSGSTASMGDPPTCGWAAGRPVMASPPRKRRTRLDSEDRGHIPETATRAERRRRRRQRRRDAHGAGTPGTRKRPRDPGISIRALRQDTETCTGDGRVGQIL